MKKVFILSSEDSSTLEECVKLEQLLNEGWIVERADRKNDWTIIYILSK